ncbi:MAG: DUF4357 domain-containing protein [Anaeroplasmataceae bacterium]|nr:DUF4357 domain-containing protein [Anaeroplasmataceae bacterium]
MARGIIYVMSSCVEGLVKIGKTGLGRFEDRMSTIERNGYHRISVLKREFAIEVEDYDEKEKLLHEIFSKSRVGDSELFSVNINLVKQLMASLEGQVIYPIDENKEEIFEEATEVIQSKSGVIPNGIYTFKMRVSGTGDYTSAQMEVCEGKLFVKAGAVLGPLTDISSGWMKIRNTIKKNGNITLEDFECSSPSMAAAIVIGHKQNGWLTWKNSNKEFIDIYRLRSNEEE